LNSAGETKATYNYDAFGKLLSQTGEIENHITYAGYIYDSETGLYYLNARMYDPETMRFMQYDTYSGRTTDALSLNRYAYCQGNPLRYIDPTGHTSEEGTGEDNTSLIAGIWSKVKSLMSQSIFGQMASDITNFVNSVKSVGFAKTCDLCMYELEDKAVEILTYTAATVLIAGGIAVTALSGGTLTVGGVALAGLGMGLISAGVSVGMMTYNQMETSNHITASVGDYLKTASLSFATGFVSGVVGSVTGGATGAITSKVFSSSVSVATQYATKYAVNFGLETLGDAFVQKVTTGEVNWKQAVISGALDTVIGASVDGVTAIVKNWDSVKYSAKSIWIDETGAIEVTRGKKFNAIESGSNAGLKEFDIVPYGKFKDYPGDGLTGHELLQNAWLEANGKIPKRGVGLSTKNPAIALRENPIHKFISGQQKSLGLNKKNLAGTSWRKNVLDNIQILKDAGVPRDKIAELAWQTRKFAIDNGF